MHISSGSGVCYHLIFRADVDFSIAWYCVRKTCLAYEWTRGKGKDGAIKAGAIKAGAEGRR